MPLPNTNNFIETRERREYLQLPFPSSNRFPESRPSTWSGQISARNGQRVPRWASQATKNYKLFRREAMETGDHKAHEENNI